MTDKPTCSSCKWWGSPRDKWASKDEPKGVCQLLSRKQDRDFMLDVCSHCTSVSEDCHSCGRIFTGPDFGCIHHEPKEQE